jgi:hypothetical protein
MLSDRAVETLQCIACKEAVKLAEPGNPAIINDAQLLLISINGVHFFQLMKMWL